MCGTFSNDLRLVYRQLRARTLFKGVPLRTRRALSHYKVYGNTALLVLNGALLKSINALLALSRRYDTFLDLFFVVHNTFYFDLTET